MLPQILTCPTCRSPLALDKESPNEAHCNDCDLTINWCKKEDKPPPEVFNSGVQESYEMGDIQFDFEISDDIEESNPKPLEIERSTKFSRLGSKKFQLTNSDSKNLSKYERKIYNPDSTIQLEHVEEVILKGGLAPTWEDRKPKRNKRKITKTMIALASALVVLLALIVGRTYLMNSQTPRVAENNPESTIVMEQEPTHDDALTYLQDYFQCPTWEQALEYTLLDPKLKEVLPKYWKPYKVSEILHLDSKKLGQDDISSHFFGVLTEEGNQFYYSVLSHPHFGLKIDWRESHQVDDLSLADLIRSTLSKPQLVRGSLIVVDKYPTQYPREQYRAFQLFDLQDNALLVYVSRAEPISDTLENKFKQESVKGTKSIPVILKVSKNNPHTAEIKNVLSLAPQLDHLAYVALPYMQETSDQ